MANVYTTLENNYQKVQQLWHDNERHAVEEEITSFLACTTWESSTIGTVSILSSTAYTNTVYNALAYIFFNKHKDEPPQPKKSDNLFDDYYENIEWEVTCHKRRLARTSWLISAALLLRESCHDLLNIRRLEDSCRDINKPILTWYLDLLDNATKAAIGISIHPAIYKRCSIHTKQTPQEKERFQYPDLSALLLDCDTDSTATVEVTGELLKMVKPSKEDYNRKREADWLFTNSIAKALTFVEPENVDQHQLNLVGNTRDDRLS